MKKIAIITTRQNYRWESMKEVLPSLEQCWQKSNVISRIINVDVEPMRDVIGYIFSCDAMVVIAFNETVARFLMSIRKVLQIKIPIVLHLYGHATLAAWPQIRFCSDDFFTEGDAFVGTCEGDLRCMKLSFRNVQIYNIPYPYFDIELKKDNLKNKKIFCFIGRISDQKNIDLLIRSYAKALAIDNSIPDLHIYGKEDHLGWPNMGLPSCVTVNDLNKLIKNLNINERVVFNGFRSREEIYGELGTNHIFVSASTHSDENFGMAAMRSLAIGGKAVLTSWGGHKEFKIHHPERVWTSEINFNKDTCRPQIDIDDFSKKLIESYRSLNDSKIGLANYFLPENVANSFENILNEIFITDKIIIPTEFARKIYQQQNISESEGNIQKAFTGHCDPLALSLLRAYA